MSYRCSDCGQMTAPSPMERCWHCEGERRLTVRQRAYRLAIKELGIRQFPHGDANVLHARGECRYCTTSAYDRLHELRRRFDIAYSGASLEAGQDPCPSEAFRPPEVINLWPGNRAAPS